MIELLKKLVSIPSFSREEGEAASFLEGWMKERGLNVHRTGNNLWVASSADSSKPTILLNAHIDTVRPVGWSTDPFTPLEEGDKITGLGTNDDLASLVSLLEAYRILTVRDQPYNLVFSATAEEEVSGKGGVEMILNEIGEISVGVVGEPTSMKIAVAEKGLMVLDCCANGVAGHAARNDGDNAIYRAMKDIEWFRTYRFPLVSEFLGEVHMNVTQIAAGQQHNVIPDRCSFTVDVRGNGLYTNREILDIVSNHVACQVNARSTRLNSTTSQNNAIIKRGEQLGLEKFGSPTLSNQALLNFDTLKIGPGDSSRSHAAGEYILRSEIEDAVKTYVQLLDGIVL